MASSLFRQVLLTLLLTLALAIQVAAQSHVHTDLHEHAEDCQLCAQSSSLEAAPLPAEPAWLAASQASAKFDYQTNVKLSDLCTGYQTRAPPFSAYA